MTAAQCVRCARPAPDAYACHHCALSLAETLQNAAGHAEDAETVIARQARYGGGSRGGSSEPLPVDLTASARYAAVENAIGTWARHVVEERGMELPVRRPTVGPLCEDLGCEHSSCARIRSRRPPSGLARAAAWLATQVGWLRKRPEAREAFRELHDACDQLARLVDRPPDKELVGMCDCGRTLYAAHGRGVVTCPEPKCKLQWHVERSRKILRDALDGKLFTAGEAARLAVRLDDGDRTTEQVRKLINAWASRGLVAAHGVDRYGDPTYRFGDVLERLARTPRRAAREAAEMGA